MGEKGGKGGGGREKERETTAAGAWMGSRNDRDVALAWSLH